MRAESMRGIRVLAHAPDQISCRHTRCGDHSSGLSSCSFRSILYLSNCLFQLRIQRGDFVQLGYFNGPWITRIALVLVVIWWGLWEIGRLTLLKEMLGHFSSLTWQKTVCRFYILSNLGFAEPSIILTLVILLHASLQKRESGTLSRRWNRKTILHILFFCLPVLIMQLGLVLLDPNSIRRLMGERRCQNTSSTLLFGRWRQYVYVPFV
ncbi:Uncharacterized protein M6B38_226210 [Iris pallida]|uniref:Uncharacterized protein n=1 Tax=Iris pallida TaxID=29817 RepID=A0AAX6DU78_IRIPA|nr:Uncharacterized protein M6B38_226210 [Iris pallida]